jgi:hypothetical protein
MVVEIQKIGILYFLFPNSLKSILFIGICSAFFSCTPIYNDRLPDPKIQAGIAKVEGKLSIITLKKGNQHRF